MDINSTSEFMLDVDGDLCVNGEDLLIKRPEPPCGKIEFRSEGGKYAILDLDAGTVESNIPRDEQVGVIVEALEQLAKQYGVL